MQINSDDESKASGKVSDNLRGGRGPVKNSTAQLMASQVR